LRDTDTVGNSPHCFSPEVVNQCDWEVGNSQQAISAAIDQSDMQDIVQSVTETEKLSDSRQSFPLEVNKFGDGGETASSQ
jgi:hypothetical protein